MPRIRSGTRLLSRDAPLAPLRNPSARTPTNCLRSTSRPVTWRYFPVGGGAIFERMPTDEFAGSPSSSAERKGAMAAYHVLKTSRIQAQRPHLREHLTILVRSGVGVTERAREEQGLGGFGGWAPGIMGCVGLWQNQPGRPTQSRLKSLMALVKRKERQTAEIRGCPKDLSRSSPQKPVCHHH